MTPLLEKLVFFYADLHGIHKLLDILARTKLVEDLSQNPNMVFLPHLESLSFIRTQEGSPPWDLVLSLFPPSWHPADAQYRPLRRLEFGLFIRNLEVSDYLDKDVLLQIREIQRRNFDLIILSEDDNGDNDLIQVSYDLHFGSQINLGDNLGVEDREEVDEGGDTSG